ncbi:MULTISPECIES: glycosyltransferase [Halococcus]|uniref:Glycosyltransferase n=1 Tax=Halococcus salifodinae DSM 8989 TaxID=1227456 RepID=M0N6I6_9EURY|nr:MULTISPECIES: glycosyltransferase [Halococcus]EMA53517.1 glycosyltransferase [Halococcus salifodinae DSM 8989]
MKICFISGVFLPQAAGGAENYVLEVAKRLKRKGHELFVIATEPYDGPASLTPHRTSYEGIDVWRFSPINVAYKTSYEGYSLPRQAVWRALDAVNPHSVAMVERLLDRTNPDVVHVNELEGISTLSSRAAARNDAAYVHTLHNYNLISPGSTVRIGSVPGGLDRTGGNHPLVTKGYSRIQRALLGTPDTVVGPSQFVIDAHREHGFFEGVRCRCLQHGVERIAESTSPPPDDPSVLYVGRLTPEKGLNTLFAAAADLSDVQFDLCGTGPLQSAVECRAESSANLTYHGFVTEAELRSLRRNATVGVVPSVWAENSPLAIYESYATGLPVVGTDVGGIPELVVSGETGALCDPGRADALVNAIERVLDNDPAAMREAALAWAREHTLETHVDSLVEIYAESRRNR